MPPRPQPAPRRHEDLVTLQILELLEYAELRKLPALERLCDLVRGLEHHADRQVAETAERVTKARAGDV